MLRACTDNIHMPSRDMFIGTATGTVAEAHTSTELHDLTLWTGIENRCNRHFGERFGDYTYAMQELLAELEEAFLCADLGTDTLRADHAQYLD